MAAVRSTPARVSKRQGLKASLHGPAWVFCVCLFLASASFAQQQNSSPASRPDGQAIRVSTELVKIDAIVLDKHKNFAEGLAQKDFRVLVDGVEQPVVFFSPVDAPAQVLVMVETSPAVYLIHKQHLVAAYALLQGLAAEDQVALVTYSQSAQALMGFTTDKAALAAALGQIQYTLGSSQLNFYDSVSAVLDWMASSGGKKAVVLLTTGLDSSPTARWDALLQKLRQTAATIFPVALGGSLRNYDAKKSKSTKKNRESAAPAATLEDQAANPLSFEKANEALLSIAGITGGRAYFPSSENDFVPMYREIAAYLRHQYVLGIEPAHDGEYHTLSVEILDGEGRPRTAPAKKPEYQVLARQGYQAPKP
ncbi:MAG: VWA domain-containing protein [Candidatus Acidiferrales bacterium]